MGGKNHQIAIRFDEETYSRLLAEAEKRGESITNYVRSSAVMRLNGLLIVYAPARAREGDEDA